MKVQFNREALAQALSLVGSIVPARTPKPILRCVKLSAAKESVNVSATDLEVGINFLISEVSVDKEGETVVPADRLTAIVRESIDEVLILEANEGKCEIRGADQLQLAKSAAIAYLSCGLHSGADQLQYSDCKSL